MMTVKNIGQMLELLESNYGEKFYDGVNKDNVVRTWSVMFRDDDPEMVLQGVLKCINTMPYKPTIADIRKRMAQAQMSGQITEIDAFNEIEKAVDRADSKHNAAVAFSELSPILQRIAGHPSKLQTWRKVSEESFHTVIMSQICRSYRELAQREADYYALPATMQKAEKWRIETNKAEYLPIPEDTKTISDVIEDANRKSAEHGMQMTAELTDKHKSRVDAFLQPVTKDDIKRYEKRFLR